MSGISEYFHIRDNNPIFSDNFKQNLLVHDSMKGFNGV